MLALQESKQKCKETNGLLIEVVTTYLVLLDLRKCTEVVAIIIFDWTMHYELFVVCMHVRVCSHYVTISGGMSHMSGILISRHI